MDPWVIRPPRPEDAEALGVLHVRIWQHAYRGLLHDELLDGLEVDARVRRWRAAGEAVDSRGTDPDGKRILAAFVDGAPVGMAIAAPGGLEADAAETELLSLNVSPRWHGTGVADALTNAVLPTGAVFLWVLSGNARAMAFYRKHGFAPDGTSRYDPAWDCTDLKMRRPVDNRYRADRIRARC